MPCIRATPLDSASTQQIGQQQHLHAARAQRGRERVVLLLCAGEPRDAVEEQLVVVARGEAAELRPRPVQHDRPERVHLAADAVRRVHAAIVPASG
jgi:hypothetical protein